MSLTLNNPTDNKFVYTYAATTMNIINVYAKATENRV